jgi:signal transduction histidine kinase
MNGIFKKIFDSTFVGLAIFDAKTLECIKINPTGMETLGIQMQDGQAIPQFKISDLYSDLKRANIIDFGATHIKSESFFHEIAMKRLNGHVLYAEISIRKILSDEGNQYILLTFKDITYQLKLRREITNKQEEIEKAYDEILAQNKELKDLDKMKDKFIALTSHELRTPLSAMVATSEVLELKLYDTEEQMKEFIHTIYDQGKYLLAIVNDILDFSKIQAGKLDVFISQQDPLPILESTKAQFVNMAKEKGVEIVIDKKTEDNACYVDELRIKQVFSNILSNAVKFTNPNSKVTLVLESDVEFTYVSIIDQGPGIPDGAEQKIFNEFETLQNIKTHHKGTGLGLPISLKIMKIHGGDIIVKKNPSGGAVFMLTIPRNQVLAENMYRARPNTDIEDLAA